MLRFVSIDAARFAVLGLSLAAASSVVACPRPGGGGYRPAPSYRPAPTYRPAPAYRPQPTFSQPAFPPQQTFPTQPGGFPQAPPQQAPPAPTAQPVQQAAASQPTLQQPIAQQPDAPQPVAQAQPQQPPANAPAASLTALEILAGMSAPQPQAQGQSQAPAVDPRVGTFTATVSGGTTVRLELRADRTFVWTATSNGKTSSFQGSYEMSGSSLTLTRSSDEQRLAAQLTDIAGGFNFKLEGGSDSGLDFVRS